MVLLKEFCERNPLTRLKVVVAPSREIVRGVGEGRWELGFGRFTTPCRRTSRCIPASPKSATDDCLRSSGPRGAAPIRRYHARLALVTSYLDESARRPSGERLRDALFGVGGHHMELRVALVADGKGERTSQIW